MQEQHHSDFLPWVLTAAAVLIMAVAVHVGARDERPPQPRQHETGSAHESPPARA